MYYNINIGGLFVITPDYIERSNRRTLSLTVMKDGNVVVKAPLKMSDEVINNFVLEKQNWIKEKLSFVNLSSKLRL